MQIGTKELEFPLIQGGMGVGVSLGNLAGHVARDGGVGVISSVNAARVDRIVPVKELMDGIKREYRESMA